MLTLEKLNVYRKFDGDIDAWARWAVRDSSGMTDDDWWLIDELRQGLFIVTSGQAAPEFGRAVEQRLFSVTSDDSTREMLRTLSQRRKPWWRL